MTLYYYAYGASGTASKVLDSSQNGSFISYLTNLGYNSSFTVKQGKFTDITIRFSSNDSKLRNNTVALTDKSFTGLNLTLHANNTQNSNSAGGIAKNGAVIELSSVITSYTVNLDGDIIMGDTTNTDFVKLNGTKITVNPSVKAGATAVIGSANANGTYRTMTFVNGGDGTYTIKYNTANTLSNADSTFYLNSSFNNQDSSDVFHKTDNSDIITLTKELSAGKYTFKVYNLGTDKWYGKNDTVIADTTNRLTLVNAGNECVLNATGGIYEFKYEISTNRLSIYSAPADAVILAGDCNSDGKFDVADVVLLQNWLHAVPNTHLANWKATDICEDNKLDIFDLCMMKRMLPEK
ncbi:MAG: dockerin type I repeat-containing protein [Ruminococcus sp.]|nr:dockerin type I repeat-containing protein [Ruminococcus sp.]